MIATLWTQAAAHEWFRDQQPLARAAGWCLAMTGSLAEGRPQARDLDVIATPIVCDPADLAAVFDSRAWRKVHIRRQTRFGVQARVYQDEHDRLLDIIFLPVRG